MPTNHCRYGDYEFGRLFKKARLRRGLTRDELAEQLGVTEPRIRQLEHAGRLTFTAFHRIATAMRLTRKEREALVSASVTDMLPADWAPAKVRLGG